MLLKSCKKCRKVAYTLVYVIFLLYFCTLKDDETMNRSRVKETILSVWARIAAWARPVWERFAAWARPVWERCYGWCKAQALRVRDWYLAQQEIIKKRSEVSHERLTVKRAVLLFMETWGLGSRNIFYTMWHLIWRPGYMIGDYLNGRRSRYMQPFFMFFVLTLILVQMAWALDVQLPKNRDMTLTAFKFIHEHDSFFSAEQKTNILKTAQWLDAVHDWRDENRAWDLIIHSFGIVLVTWLLWRKSPRVGEDEWETNDGKAVEGYNFAEIVTAVAYILCQLQLLSMVTMLLFRKLPFDHIRGFAFVPELVLFLILLIDLKQLFQRKWWPTVWRTFVIVLFI